MADIYVVERSTKIAAVPADVFGHVVDLHEWEPALVIWSALAGFSAADRAKTARSAAQKRRWLLRVDDVSPCRAVP